MPTNDTDMVQQIITGHNDGDVVNRWMLIADITNLSTGDRGTVTVCSDHLQVWEALGLADYIRVRETAQWEDIESDE